jgi:hypothetical protein
MLLAFGCGGITYAGAYQVHLSREAAVTGDELSYEPANGCTVERHLHAAHQGLRFGLVEAAHGAVLTGGSAVVANLQTAILVIMHGVRLASCVLAAGRVPATRAVQTSKAADADSF